MSMSSMSMSMSMPVDPADREAYNVRLAMAGHHRRVMNGSKCRDCWFEPRNCMCSLAKEWLQLQVPRPSTLHQAAQQRPIQFLMLFHSREVGNLSSTGKLVVAGGLGTGFVNGWVDDPDQSHTIGLRGDVGFATALDDAARLGPVAVLYPADDAVEVTHFHNLCRPNIENLARPTCRNSTAIEAPLDVNVDVNVNVNATSCDDIRMLTLTLTLTVVVLDGTYRQARLLNRLAILSKFTRVRINPTGSTKSEFDSLRTQSKLRQDLGRTSTIEAVAALLHTYEPTVWGTHAVCEQWQQALRFMVDNVRLQRGLPSCYGLDQAVALNSERQRQRP